MDGATFSLILIVTVLILGVARVMWLSYLNQRQRELHHRERMAALEKGVQLPPLPSMEESPGVSHRLASFYRDTWTTPQAYLRRGLVWFFLGLGLMGFLYGLSVSNVRERAVDWYYSVPLEKRPVPPPVEKRAEPPLGWALLGLIPAGVGVAYILFYAIEGRKIQQNGAQK
jgi:hypothetical protein